MPIPLWPRYADLPLAPKCRSRTGSNMPVGDTPFVTAPNDIGGGDEIVPALTPAPDQLRSRAVPIDQCAQQDVRVENNPHQARYAKRSLRTSARAYSISSSICSDGTSRLYACAASRFS